jgi:sugar-specific transcriptional regulator TrmB
MEERLYDILPAIQEIENLETLSEEEREEYYNALINQRDQKIEDTLKVIRQAEITAEMCDVEIKRLKEQKEYYENRVKRIKQSISFSMERFGIKRIETAFARLYFKPSESLVVVDEKDIPEAFILTKEVKQVDKTALKKAIKDGLTVEGVYIEHKNNLQLK